MNVFFKTLMIIIVPLLVGCVRKTKSELLQGEWKFVASYDLITNKELDKFNSEDPIFVIIDSNSINIKHKLNQKKNDKYFWHMKQDSLYVTTLNKMNTFPIFLKTLNEEKLVLELYAIGETKIELERIK